MDEREGPHGGIFGIGKDIAVPGDEPADAPVIAAVAAGVWPPPRRRVVRLWKHQLRSR